MNASVPHRSWVEIDLAALERNLGRIRAEIPADHRYVAVVKADAYGHGLRAMATRLMQSGAELFAVANVEEARQIRELGSGWPILLLSPVLHGEEARLFEDDLIPTLSSVEDVRRFQEIAAARGSTLSVHLKIDTGMGRLGIWHESAGQLFQAIQTAPNLRLAGVFTHFACATTDPEFTHEQRKRFLRCLEENQPLPRDLLIHADNSAGLETFNPSSPFNAIRVGLLQCGVLPYPGSILAKVKVEPVLSFHTRVGLVKSVPAGTGISYSHLYTTHRPSTLAVLTAGYADGIPVSVSGKEARVLIRGRAHPLIGRICMDQAIVDVTDHPGVAVGDRATLIGRQGEEEVSLETFARSAGTIPYEILTSLSKRVTRLYKTSRDL